MVPGSYRASTFRSRIFTSRANADDKQSETTSNESATPPKVVSYLPEDRSFKRPPTPYTSGMKLERVERLGKESWAGVASVDRGEDPNAIGKTALLAGGDLVVFLVFASIGRLSHGEGLSIISAMETAFPFHAGWFLTAPFLDAYGKSARNGSIGSAIRVATKAWIVAVPLGIAVRSLLKGYMPETSFIIVSMVATGVLMVGWRSALAYATLGSAGGDIAGGNSSNNSSKNRRGNPFELIGLLISLVKRW